MSPKVPFKLTAIPISTNILIGYHMGCVDGVTAAYILKRALDFLGLKCKIVPIAHAGKRFAMHVEEGQTIFSVDVSPSLEDLEALGCVSQLIILDHHVSEKDTHEKLGEALGEKLVNLSDLSGEHCGASLVHRMVMESIEGLHFDMDVIHMVHKMDVFQHPMPSHLDADFLSFKSFLVRDGERNVSLESVGDMFTDKVGSLAIGKQLSKPILDRTRQLFESAVVLVETSSFRILLCVQAPECRPIDFHSYQELIDSKIDGKRTLFLTQDMLPNSHGIYNVGLRRSGDNLNVTTVAMSLKVLPPFISGGGHPYAGGVQSNVLVSTDDLLRACVEVLSGLHPC